MLRSTALRKTLLTLFGIDVAVFVFSWAPTTMFNYVGSESFEGYSLAAGLVSLIGGIVLLPFVAIILLGRQKDPK